MRLFALATVALISGAVPAAAQTPELARGTVIPRVSCAEKPEQTYALYLPATYSPDRAWSLVLAFHPAADGPRIVETFRAGAEQLGYIVAASNNARNGPHEVSAAAAQAMGADVSRRFAIDARRVYVAGFSGGGRVALGLALANPSIAGVIASSAGFPDSQPRAELPFAVYSTAGVEDFNYLEMRLLDRELRSPHFLSVFAGGHVLPPEDVATEALEWLEIQAMRSGVREKDVPLATRILERRRARLAASSDPVETFYLLDAVVRDFTSVLDVSAEARQLEAMSRQPEVKKAIARAREMDNAEARMLNEMLALTAQLAEPDRRVRALSTLRARFAALSRKASEPESAEGRQARRVLRSLAAAARTGRPDREYLAILEAHPVPAR
jgi:hypothetical protein